MEPEILRSFERLVVVLGGVLAIYLGYRLFNQVPFAKSASGEFSLPKVRVSLFKVGPGIFFALFGASILGVSLFKPIFVGGSSGSARVVQSTEASFLEEVGELEISDYWPDSLSALRSKVEESEAIPDAERREILNSIRDLRVRLRQFEVPVPLFPRDIYQGSAPRETPRG